MSRSVSSPPARLQRDLERSIRLGHPWVWREAVQVPDGTPSGAVLDIVGPDGRFLARGLYDARSPIAVRVVTLDPSEAVDSALVRRRVEAALRARAGAFDPAETNAWRLLNGEGDGLPGVVCDVYGPVAVLRLEGPADPVWRDPVVEAVTAVLPVAHVVERPRTGKARLLHGGEPPDPVEIRECGVRFLVDVKRGQKTGFFLDQRENRRLLRWHAAGLQVANLFGYTGGFSVHAALVGATRVVTVDSAPPAIDMARENFRRNGLDPDRHGFEVGEAFAWLAAARAGRHRFGLVILDPPSFAPSEKSLGPALESYRRLNAAALAVVAPEGLLASSSCSSHVDGTRFLEVLSRSAADAGRPLRVLEVRGQPADHPSPPGFPEGRYLKFVLARAAS